MPSSQDQLTKLSGTIFICTVMGNFLTSLGTMDESEIAWCLTQAVIMGRSATCTASGAICFLCALILLQAAVRSLIIRSVEFCEGKSDYKWSVTLVSISQAIAIVVGSIAPTIRWMNAISFHSPKIWNKRCLKKGKFWIRRLVEWKEKPLQFHIGNRRYRKIVLVSKIHMLNVFIGMQSAVVIVSKLIALTSILPMSWLINFFSCCNNRLGKEELTQSESELGNLLQWIMTNGRADFTISQGFQGVVEFDSNQVPLLGTETRRPPNCWALPIVNLTSIAIAIAFPYVEADVIKSLHLGVHEGLKYVRLIEEHLDRKRTINVRNAADIV
ncbi:LOW QUALITY PROTEIN: hypothetical protein CKAN_02394000 [Cinnamomum micranthum f. kanehirae]|uniref:Uncharacterized protein n=1 Tax=Cinnamomum micranthum f. kanehirae TaxID=337451 RepID=A0A443PV49_9MAGN|nr:LOW QUALITY PROTEIN: hypothetical protein CKAN_02394000 [Cinnamomum micranthum f. kanehirae]